MKQSAVLFENTISCLCPIFIHLWISTAVTKKTECKFCHHYRLHRNHKSFDTGQARRNVNLNRPDCRRCQYACLLLYCQGEGQCRSRTRTWHTEPLATTIRTCTAQHAVRLCCVDKHATRQLLTFHLAYKWNDGTLHRRSHDVGYPVADFRTVHGGGGRRNHKLLFYDCSKYFKFFKWILTCFIRYKRVPRILVRLTR